MQRLFLLSLLAACGAPNTPPVVELSPPDGPVPSHVPLKVGVAASDADGDALALAYVWTGPGGRRVVTDGPRLAPTHTRRGDTWTLEVTADDGQDTTTAVASIEVVNGPPRIRALDLDPPVPFRGRSLRAVADLHDGDGDPLTLVYTWTVDDEVVQEGPDDTFFGPLRRGQVVAVALTADDGIETASARREAVVGNAPPQWAFPTFEPFPITRAAPVHVSTYGLLDPDGDPVVPRVRWLVDGQEVVAGEALPPEAFTRGARIKAELSAYDGIAHADLGTLVGTVVDAPPRVSIAVAPTRAVPGETVTATVVADDPDGDPVTPTVSWSTGHTGPVLVVPELDPGTVITVQATASGVVAEAAVEVMPAEPWVVVEPEEPRGGDRLRCLAAPGAALAWSRNGAPVTVDGDAVPARLTRPGDVWRCTASWDGTDSLSAEVTVGQDAPGGNVLVVILDDIGIDKVRAYGAHPDAPPTPTLDRLAEEGAMFRNAHAQPLCSPTRASVLTGLHARRTGIGHAIDILNDRFGLSPALPSLPDVLARSPYGYATAIVGKWHLTTLDDPWPWLAPGDFGFHDWRVILGNPRAAAGPIRTRDYFLWEEADRHGVRDREEYLVSAQVDDALETIDRLPEPWFLWVAFSGAHEPTHVPPAHLITQAVDENSPRADLYDAMVEAVDTELGRLLAGIHPDVLADTTVIVFGDNGTPRWAMREPWISWGGKGSVFEGGSRVPFFVTGPLVAEPGIEIEGLVHVVDVLPTVAAIAGAPLQGIAPLDGVSFLPMLADPDATVRDVVFTERFEPNGGGITEHQMAVRDARWRLLRDADGVDHLFDYAAGDGVHDGPDLLAGTPDDEALAALAHLRATLDGILAGFEVP